MDRAQEGLVSKVSARSAPGTRGELAFWWFVCLNRRVLLMDPPKNTGAEVW